MTATTLSLIVIFLPVAFMGGIIGRFFQSFGVTVAFAIAISLLVSFTLTPMLSSRFLRPKDPRHSAKEGAFYRAIDRFYGACLRWSLNHRAVILLLSLAVTLTTGPLIRAVGTQFVPQDDQSEFEVIVQTPGGIAIFYDTGQGQGFRRNIVMNGSPHLPSSIRQLSGDW